jgi:hypothetical protein
MALTRRSATGLITGLMGLGIMASNPNYNKDDIRRPYQIIQKLDKEPGFEKSGITYGLGAATAGGAGVYLTYNLLTGNLVARRREE